MHPWGASWQLELLVMLAEDFYVLFGYLRPRSRTRAGAGNGRILLLTYRPTKIKKPILHLCV
jgi:hypothetical protein